MYVAAVHHVLHRLERVGVAVVNSDGVCCCPLQILDNNCRHGHASLVPAAWSCASSAAPPLVWSEWGCRYFNLTVDSEPHHTVTPSPQTRLGRQFSCVQAGCVMSLLCNMCSLQPHTRESISSPADECLSPLYCHTAHCLLSQYTLTLATSNLAFCDKQMFCPPASLGKNSPLTAAHTWAGTAATAAAHNH